MPAPGFHLDVTLHRPLGGRCHNVPIVCPRLIDPHCETICVFRIRNRCAIGPWVSIVYYANRVRLCSLCADTRGNMMCDSGLAKLISLVAGCMQIIEKHPLRDSNPQSSD